MKLLHMVAYILLFVGGLNWGLVGLFHFDLVMTLFGSMPMLASLVYILVGASTIYLLFTHKSYCKFCGVAMKK